MTFVTAMRLIVLAAIAAFGGGFAWGVADHRGIAAVADFADHHIVFPKPETAKRCSYSLATAPSRSWLIIC